MTRNSIPVFLGQAKIGSNLLAPPNNHVFEVSEEEETKIEVLKEEDEIDQVVIFDGDAEVDGVEIITDDTISPPQVEIITDDSEDFEIKIFK